MRPKRRRVVEETPLVTYFKPVGVPLRDLEQIDIGIDEYEALRLKELEGKSQEEVAKEMGISQPTLHRILDKVYKKIAAALVLGKALKIIGGDYVIKTDRDFKNSLVAVSAFDDNIDGMVHERFGRCLYFVFVKIRDGQVKEFSVLKNVQTGQSGIGSAQIIIQQKVDAVITGNIGPRALEILTEFNVPVFYSEGSIREALKDLIAKTIKQL